VEIIVHSPVIENQSWNRLYSGKWVGYQMNDCQFGFDQDRAYTAQKNIEWIPPFSYLSSLKKINEKLIALDNCLTLLAFNLKAICCQP
jgi:hypothetical protein